MNSIARHPRFAPVAPIQTLIQLNERGLLGSYILLLAHDVVKQPKKYAAFIESFSGDVILDNSLIELGHPASSEMMLEACKIVNPDYVVLPDVLLDKDETVRLSTSAARKWREAGIKASFAMVAQGKNVMECLDCIYEIARNIGCEGFKGDVLTCVPRALVAEVGSRLGVVTSLANQGYSIHLLGFSDNFADDILCAKQKGVIGIDSSVPTRAGWEGLVLNSPRATRPACESFKRSREEYFLLCSSATKEMTYNLGLIHGAIRSE